MIIFIVGVVKGLNNVGEDGYVIYVFDGKLFVRMYENRGIDLGERERERGGEIFFFIFDLYV